jgi:hypothetical protein
MKTKNLFPSFMVLILFLLTLFSVNAQTNDSYYSIKNRWTVKASVSRYKTAFTRDAFMYVGDFFLGNPNRKMANFKVEANYGIAKFIEIGLFTGFQHYEWINLIEEGVDDGTGLIGGVSELRESFAPLFGATINFHVLPFFVKSKNCHWDLYLTAKYGGCYLPHKELYSPYYPYGKYRQEYGLGLGISYYIKNIIGFYAEGSVGQYAFFPSFTRIDFVGPHAIIRTSSAESNFSFRIGIAAKINK